MRSAFLWLLAIATVKDAGAASSGSCPMNFTYIQTLPWNPGSCLPRDGRNDTACCDTLLLLFGVGFSIRLRDTDNFRLPDVPTSAACLSAYQSYLTPRSLPPNIVSSCFPDPNRFVISPNACAGILTGADLVKKLGNSSSLFQSCKANVSVPVNCERCRDDGVRASAELARIGGSESQTTDCFYLVSTYAAADISEFGPENVVSAACMIGLPLLAVPEEHDRNNRSVLIICVVVACVGLVLVISILGGVYFWRRKPARAIRAVAGASSSDSRPNTGAIWYNLEELEIATEDFSPKNMIGKGGFGVVYKGKLSDGSPVAVKKIIESDIQRDEDFRNEVEIISNLRHRNLVLLRGCCISSDSDDEETGEGKQRYLVYEYMPNGSLDDHIFGGTPLTWPQRKSIIIDVAKGLSYLHYGIKPAIYHRDIKATNILLDREMRARVADFGLAKLMRGGDSNLTTRVAGTHGYLAPEYALYGQLTEKSDVYSFGIVVLEVMCGRKALEAASGSESMVITDWAWALVKAGKGAEALDPALLRNEEDRPPNPGDIMQRFLVVGILCAHVMVALRPTIREALSMLEGDIDLPQLPDRPLPIGYGYHLATEASIEGHSPATSGPSLDVRDMLR